MLKLMTTLFKGFSFFLSFYYFIFVCVLSFQLLNDELLILLTLWITEVVWENIKLNLGSDLLVLYVWVNFAFIIHGELLCDMT